MSAHPIKVFIQVESTSEQQDNIKNCRKTLKVLQKDAQDKENLVGRTLPMKGVFKKSKSETAVACASPSADFKRKKSSLSTEEKTEKTLAEITEEDLTTEGEPSEHYWKTLAERRRLALEETLTENHMLHDKVESLEQELNISRQMLDESNALVEVLNEMINAADGDENDEAQSTPSTDSENEVGSTQDVLNASIAEEAKERSNVEHNSQGTSTEDTYQSE